MAHKVKCAICGETFDRDKISFIQVNSRRYAHKDCYDKQEAQEKHNIEARKELEDYVKQLFNITSLTSKISRQINKYISEYHYTYEGILKTLKYWHEIKGNDTSKSNSGIGIVEYIYEDAKKYYYEIYKANKANEKQDIESCVFSIEEIKINPPIAKIKRKHSIHFFDEED